MNFEDMMQELRVEYVASLPKKISDVQSHVAAQDRDLLRDDFHKMKGTGKTYGIAEISELGEVVEKLCLKREIALELFIPPALDLLASIHQSRQKNLAFDLQSSGSFKKICALIK